MIFYPHEFNVKKFESYQDEETGEIKKEWVTIGEFEGEVVALSGDEIIEADQLNNPLDFTVFMDYDPRINSDMRVFFGELVLEIHAPLPTMPDFNGEYEQLILKCSSQLKKG